MRFKRCCIGFLICCLAFMSCCGCQKKKTGTKEDNPAQTEKYSMELQYSASSVYPDKTILRWVVPYGIPDNSDRIFAAFNEKLDQKGLPYAVDFYAFGKPEEYADFLTYSKENRLQMDVFNIGYAYYAGYFTDIIRSGYCIDLDSYLSSGKGKKLYDSFEEYYWKALSDNGKCYGISPSAAGFERQYYGFNKVLAEKYEVDTARMVTDSGYYRDTLRKVCEGERGGRFFGLVSPLAFMFPTPKGYWPVSSPVGLRMTEGKLTAVNLCEDVEVKENVLCYVELYQNGLVANGISEASAPDKITLEEINGGKFFMIIDSEKQDYENCIWENGTVIPVNKEGNVNCIASWSEHRGTAFDLLAEVYTDPELSILLAFGIEGIQYSLKDGLITPEEDRLEGTASWAFFPNQSILPAWNESEYHIRRNKELSEEEKERIEPSPVLGKRFLLKDCEEQLQKLLDYELLTLCVYQEKVWKDGNLSDRYETELKKMKEWTDVIVSVLNRQIP